MKQAELNSLRLTFRHEAGHLVVGKSLSFPIGEMKFDNAKAGQAVDLHPSIKTIADMTKFAEDRITSLYAGVLAQNLNNGVCDRSAAERSLTTTAQDDFSKIRELMRLSVAATYPDATFDEFTAHLEETRQRLFDRSAKMVEANASLIGEVTNFFMREAINTQKTQRGQQTKTISKDIIDDFLKDKTVNSV